MAKKKFTIDNIKEFIKELGFEWIDKLIYDSNNQKYRTAKMIDLKKENVKLLLKSVGKKQPFVAMATISNDEFAIFFGNSKMDASLVWKDFLLEQNDQKVKRNECLFN